MLYPSRHTHTQLYLEYLHNRNIHSPVSSIWLLYPVQWTHTHNPIGLYPSIIHTHLCLQYLVAITHLSRVSGWNISRKTHTPLCLEYLVAISHTHISRVSGCYILVNTHLCLEYLIAALHLADIVAGRIQDQRPARLVTRQLRYLIPQRREATLDVVSPLAVMGGAEMLFGVGKIYHKRLIVW